MTYSDRMKELWFVHNGLVCTCLIFPHQADYMAGIEEVAELRTAMDQFLLSDCPPFVGNKKQFLDELSVDVSKDYDNLGKNIENLENILTQIESFIKYLDRNQASLSKVTVDLNP